jgi:hypothetical protein
MQPLPCAAMGDVPAHGGSPTRSADQLIGAHATQAVL